MIDLSLYRCRIGIFCGGKGWDSGQGGELKDQCQDFSVFNPTNILYSTKFYRFEQASMSFEEAIIHKTSYFTSNKIFMLLYLYIMLIFSTIILSFTCSPKFNISYTVHPGVVYL